MKFGTFEDIDHDLNSGYRVLRGPAAREIDAGLDREKIRHDASVR
jgi:hypothetical protein